MFLIHDRLMHVSNLFYNFIKWISINLVFKHLYIILSFWYITSFKIIYRNYLKSSIMNVLINQNFDIYGRQISINLAMNIRIHMICVRQWNYYPQYTDIVEYSFLTKWNYSSMQNHAGKEYFAIKLTAFLSFSWENNSYLWK